MSVLDKVKKTREYVDYIEEHIINVQRCWKELQEKCIGGGFIWLSDDFIFWNINENIKNHDESKLTKEEFTQYRNYFFNADYEERNKADFKKAWDNHLIKNDHHWQTWTQKDYMYDNQKLIYLIENICDWMAMGVKFGDTAKEYYENNKEEIKLPEWAIKEMYRIFEIIYK